MSGLGQSHAPENEAEALQLGRIRVFLAYHH